MLCLNWFYAIQSFGAVEQPFSLVKMSARLKKTFFAVKAKLLSQKSYFPAFVPTSLSDEV